MLWKVVKRLNQGKDLNLNKLEMILFDKENNIN